jgi:hypothetical protein
MSNSLNNKSIAFNAG